MGRWASWVGAGLLALGMPLASLQAQAPQQPADKPAAPERPVALPYAVAAGMTIVLLLLLCMPTRKGQ